MTLKHQRTVAIVGCGILGASHALEFSKIANTKVIVLEAAPGPAMNSGTGASSACVRRCYSSESLTLMADYGARFLSELQTQNPGNPLFVKAGCLSLAKQGTAFLESQIQIFLNLDFKFQSLDHLQLKKKYPALSFSTDEIGLLDQESGYASPHLVTEVLVKQAREAGAEFHFNCRAASLILSNGEIKGIQLADHRIISADLVILASAVGTKNLLDSVDIHLPAATSIRPVFTAFLERSDSDPIPVIADLPNEIYLRQEGAGVLIGSLAERDEEAIITDAEAEIIVDHLRLQDLIERTAHRLPNVNLNPSRVKVVRGLYDVNDTDWMPIQCEAGVKGLYVSFATSGHGFKLAFALSKMLSAEIGIADLPDSLSRVGKSLFNLSHDRLTASGVLA